jgi:hypothetical protein
MWMGCAPLSSPLVNGVRRLRTCNAPAPAPVELSSKCLKRGLEALRYNEVEALHDSSFVRAPFILVVKSTFGVPAEALRPLAANRTIQSIQFGANVRG